MHLLTDFQGRGQRLSKHSFFVLDPVWYWIQIGDGDLDVVGKGPVQFSYTQDFALHAMPVILLQAPWAKSASGINIRHYPLTHNIGFFRSLDHLTNKLVPKCSGEWNVSG
jgi:hypothetical protein